MERRDHKQDRTTAGPCWRCAEKINRRHALLSVGIGSLGLSMAPSLLFGQADPAAEAVQTGDLLVKTSDSTNKPLVAADIAVGVSPVLVWPMRPAGNVVRSQNRFNQLLLIRLDPATLDADTKALSVDGVMAFCAVCPHAGCTIDEWVPERSVLACDCHGSEFDPRQAGKVTDGPSAQPLPGIGLKILDGKLAVAKAFAAPPHLDE